MESFSFKNTYQIGAVDAEHDSFLNDCFVDTGTLDCLFDMEDSRTLLLGRTGSGKSAIMSRIVSQSPHAIPIDPEILSLVHIASSDVMQRVMDAGGHLDLIFKALWRSVLCIEIFRHVHKTKGSSTASAWLASLQSSKKGNGYKEAVQYLETYAGDFFVDRDHTVRELVTNYGNELRAGVKLDAVDLGAIRKDSLAEKDVFQRTVTRFISEKHAPYLPKLLGLADYLLSDEQKPVFVCVDRLDEDWVEDQFRYRLIRALIETSRDFGRVRNCKVILALREDLLSAVLEDPDAPRIQREKYDGICLHLNWSKNDLRRVADTRITTLVRRKYEPSAEVRLEHLLQEKNVTAHEPPIQFILNRTLLRPRDVILFVNEAIALSHQSPVITNETLLSAERTYSSKRLDALVDEWASIYPGLGALARSYPHPNETILFTQVGEHWAERAHGILSRSNAKSDPFLRDINALYEGSDSSHTTRDWTDVRRHWVQVLFRTGFLGVTIRGSAPQFSFHQPSGLRLSNFPDEDISLRVHKAFVSGLTTL